MLSLILNIGAIVLLLIIAAGMIYDFFFTTEEEQSVTVQRVLTFYDDTFNGKQAHRQANDWIEKHPGAKVTQHSSSFIGGRRLFTI